jgi:hypothetical protein
VTVVGCQHMSASRGMFPTVFYVLPVSSEIFLVKLSVSALVLKKTKEKMFNATLARWIAWRLVSPIIHRSLAPKTRPGIREHSQK